MHYVARAMFPLFRRDKIAMHRLSQSKRKKETLLKHVAWSPTAVFNRRRLVPGAGCGLRGRSQLSGPVSRKKKIVDANGRLSGFRFLGADRPRRRRGGYKYRPAARLLWHDFALFSRLCALSSSHRPSHHHPLHRSSERGALRFHSDFRLSEHLRAFSAPFRSLR